MGIRDIIFTSAAVFLAAGCTGGQDSVSDASSGAPGIVAEMAGQAATRTCIDSGAADLGGPLAVLWTPGDRLGVYTDDGDANVEYTLSGTASVARGTFTASGSVDGEITHAYYPYDAGNASREASALAGTVPAEQAMGGALTGDYKWGEHMGNAETGGCRFRFHNLFPLVRFVIDATGTVLENETLQTVTLSAAKADGTGVNLAGGFTFDATDGSHEVGTDVSRTLTTVWNRTLSGTLTGFATVFPEVGAGDRLTFTFETPDHRATLTVTSKVDFEPGMYYTFPLTLARFGGLSVSRKVSGTFRAATYNVKSSTSSGIGSAITADGWDFFSLSEDFSNVTSNLSAYTFGTRSRSATSLWGSDPKDGLGFATRNDKCSFSNEYVDEFDEEYGGLLEGANTTVDKGFRYYLVTMSDGVQIDVIITHMNTYETENHLACQHAQLKEVATWIRDNCGSRPVIFMGDTNCRYTRHDFETYFWSVIRQEGLTYNDPWVDYQWDGVYPTYPSNSLMVSDATGTSDTDIICSTTQNGEVVDKVIYINYAGIDAQIKALDYLRDMDYSYSDHKPIVVNFSYDGIVNMQ